MAGVVHGRSLPSGDVCFLFADVESSTALLREIGAARWAPLQEQMQRIVRTAVEANGGAVVNTEGDGCFAAFDSAAGAVRACALAQDQLTSTDWGPGIELFVRMGLHIGVDVAPRDGDYVALAVHQAARVTSAANGRQVLATNDVVMRCDDPALFADLGLFSVRDFDGPVRLFGLVRPNVPPASPRVPPAFDAQVPRYRTALVGRDADIAGILRQLEIASLVTLVGPAGVGKTRLSVAVLSQLAARLAVGPWFVDLTAAHEPRAVGQVIAAAIGCPPETDIGLHLDTLLDERAGVIVLDHCEHLLEAAASVVGLLLDWCPTVRVVATSSVPLGLPGERVHAVAPMELPGRTDAAEVMRSESGRLFLERASRVRPGGELTESAARAVHDICRAVGGLPLALELTAAAGASVAPEDVAMQLADGSLPAVIAWSLELLAPAELRALTALTVLESPIPRALAAAAARASGIAEGEVDQTLDALVRRSLLRLDPDGRYDLLLTLRSHVRERLLAVDRQLILEHLLGACLEVTAGAAVPSAAYETVAATATALIAEASLPVAPRQRLAVQMVPWWTGRLGATRARDLLLAAVALDDSGQPAAALHLAIADTYVTGSETLDTERHIQRAAVLLGEHDAIDPQFIERLKLSTTRAATRRDPDDGACR